MEKIIVLGTGNAMATKCYNTCFLFQNDSGYILTDAGGGNGILRQLEDAKVDLQQLHHVIVTHAHSDHSLGIIWLIRKIADLMLEKKYDGNFRIYCHKSLEKGLKKIASVTLQKKLTNLFDKRIKFVRVKDDKTIKMLHCPVTFFDIHSTKEKQFGFTLKTQKGKKLTCLGDEPFNQKCEKYLKKTDWLLCEAFCMYEHRDEFKPYDKHHATVKEACELAEKEKIPHVVLWHTEDTYYEKRQKLYTKEGKQFYSGDLYVPYDLDVIKL